MKFSLETNIQIHNRNTWTPIIRLDIQSHTNQHTMINTGMCLNRNIRRTHAEAEVGSSRHSFSNIDIEGTCRPFG